MADVMSPTIVIGTEESAWARRLLARMPFGGLAHFRSINKPGELTVRDVLNDLDRLREVLVDTAERYDAMDRDLNTLRSDVAAFRRVLGIPVAMHGYDAEQRPVTVKA